MINLILFFTADLYPDTLSDIAATSLKEWLQGRNVQPIMMSMQTGQNIMTAIIKKQCNNSDNNNKLINDSNYNIHMNNNGTNGVNGLNNKENDQKYDNNSMKFAFLAQQTIPDYRTQTVSIYFYFLIYLLSLKRFVPKKFALQQQITDKSQKTSTNQSTKFHQLQAIFGHQGTNIKDIANLQNNMISSKNSSRNSSLENLHIINTENEVGLNIL